MWLRIGLEKYQQQGQVVFFEEEQCQITSGVNGKSFDGYANVGITNLDYFFSIDEMYSKGTLDQLQLLRETALCVEVLYSGKFGFSSVSEMLDYINEKFNGKEIYVIEDQT